MGVTSRQHLDPRGLAYEEVQVVVKERWKNWPVEGPAGRVQERRIAPQNLAEEHREIVERTDSDELNYQLLQARINGRGWIELEGKRIPGNLVREILEERDELQRRPVRVVDLDPDFPVRDEAPLNLEVPERVMCGVCRRMIHTNAEAVIVHMFGGALATVHRIECKARAGFMPLDRSDRLGMDPKTGKPVE